MPCQSLQTKNIRSIIHSSIYCHASETDPVSTIKRYSWHLLGRMRRHWYTYMTCAIIYFLILCARWQSLGKSQENSQPSRNSLGTLGEHAVVHVTTKWICIYCIKFNLMERFKMYLNLIVAEKRMPSNKKVKRRRDWAKGREYIIIRGNTVHVFMHIAQCSSHLTNKMDFKMSEKLKPREKAKKIQLWTF